VYLVLANSCVFAQETIKEFPYEVDNIKTQSTDEINIEKRKIEKQKDSLEKSLSATETLPAPNSEENKKAILEKLETVKKQEEVVSVKEDLIKKKEEAYEKIISLIDQKLLVIRAENMPVKTLNIEISKAQADIRKFNLEKRQLSDQILSVEQEINLLEQDISAKQTLINLKDGDSYFDASITSREERLNLSNTTIEQFNKRIELIDIQSSIVNDYIVVLKNKRKERLQKHLLVSKPYSFTKKDKNFGFLLLLCLFLFSLVRRKICSIKNQTKALGHSCKKVFKFFILTAWASFISYYLFSLFGFHDLITYIGVRVLLSVVTLYAFSILYNNLYKIIVFLFCRGLEENKIELHSESPMYAAVNGAAWVLLAATTGSIVLNIWGFQHDQWFIFLDLVQFSFYKIGSVDLSLLLVIKIGLIIWGLNFFSHIFNKFLDKNIYPQAHIDESTQYTISVFIKYALVLLGIVISLRILGFAISTLNVLAGTIGIGIGIGLQEIAKNFISGIILLIERPVKVGDYIDLEGLPGRVEAVKARGTVITTFDNISVVVPNSDFITKKVTNWSYNDKIIRCCIPVGVTYGSDVDLVRKSLLEVTAVHNKVLKKPAPSVYFTEFGDNALQFKLFLWMDDAQNRFQLISDLHFMIDKLFRELNIVIAFPQRDIHLKTSDFVFEVKDQKIDKELS